MTTRIGVSPLTGRIFQGRVNKAGDAFVGEKRDVTSDVLRAVLEKAEFHGGGFDIEDGGKDAAALHTPAPQAPVKPPRRWAAYPLPLEDRFMAQLVLPLDLSAAEAQRLQQFIAALVVPWRT